MEREVQKCDTNNQNEVIAVANNGGFNDTNVPPSERRDRVLEFLDQHDMPLPPLAIYAGMRRQYRITFSYRTIQNILKDLVENDYAFRVDTKELQDGNIVEIDEGGSRRTYYFITDKGRERIQDAE